MAPTPKPESSCEQSGDKLYTCTIGSKLFLSCCHYDPCADGSGFCRAEPLKNSTHDIANRHWTTPLQPNGTVLPPLRPNSTTGEWSEPEQTPQVYTGPIHKDGPKVNAGTYVAIFVPIVTVILAIVCFIYWRKQKKRQIPLEEW
ncbi:hypothetical protein CHU98_g2225 [Xylaria longipes]|nr:hypothetical protein CHU98_g2225 [Xylaria longipes]